jgi:hypothetical protein
MAVAVGQSANDLEAVVTTALQFISSPRLSIITDTIRYDAPVIPRNFPRQLFAACSFAQLPR